MPILSNITSTNNKFNQDPSLNIKNEQYEDKSDFIVSQSISNRKKSDQIITFLENGTISAKPKRKYNKKKLIESSLLTEASRDTINSTSEPKFKVALLSC